MVGYSDGFGRVTMMNRQSYNGEEREEEMDLRHCDVDGEGSRGDLDSRVGCNKLEAFLLASHAWDDGAPWRDSGRSGRRDLLRSPRVSAEVRRRIGHKKVVLFPRSADLEEMNIFLTQQRSDWFQNLMEQAQNNIGHIKESWTTRAMIAFGPAEMEGKYFTVNEIELALAPFIGLSQNRHSLNNLVRRAARRGIIERTGKKRYVEGTRNPYPEYKVCGHIKIDIDTGVIRSFCDGVYKSHERNDSRAEV